MASPLKLSARDRTRIFRLYAKGLRPSEIANEPQVRTLSLSPRQITQLCHRAGWTQKKSEIAQARQETAREILERTRQETAAELEGILRDLASGMKTDAAELKDAWHLVETASDASSLMRAKSLFTALLMKFHGLTDAADVAAGRASARSFVCARFEEPAGNVGELAAVEVSASAPPAIEMSDAVDDGDSLNLDFDDDDQSQE